LPFALTLLGRPGADRLLDGIQRTDPLQCLVGHRRVGRLCELVELAPRMRPARRLGERVFVAIVQAVEARIAVGLQDATEGL
jgi:hypothetical protein